MSVDYYTRLEQGRHTTPSPAVLEALGRALRLDVAARAHLADLAIPTHRRRDPRPAARLQQVRPAILQMIASMTDHPALILGRRTDVLAANALATVLLTDWRRLPVRERNYTRWVLLDPVARERFPDWPAVATDTVGTLRLPEFRAAWTDHRVHQRTDGTKRMSHPEVGPISLHVEALTLPGDADQTLFVYGADPGGSSADNLRLLALSAAQRAWELRPGDPNDQADLETVVGLRRGGMGDAPK